MGYLLIRVGKRPNVGVRVIGTQCRKGVRWVGKRSGTRGGWGGRGGGGGA